MLEVTLWVLQVLLALAFLPHGWMFLAPPANLVEQMNAASRQPSASSLAGLKCSRRLA
jgi:uncharacterized membrane protein YphA (DoxX/SURF4 family)